jgi:hypothetical protein
VPSGNWRSELSSASSSKEVELGPEDHSVSGESFEHEGSTVLATEGLHLAFFDLGSPANRPGLADEAFDIAGRIVYGKYELDGDIFHKFWAALGRKRELLVWSLIFDGVYRIDIRVCLERQTVGKAPDGKSHFLGDNSGNPRLWCPSGALSVACLQDVGSPSLRPIVQIPSGMYRVSSVADHNQQASHEFLDEVEQYRDGDGPDWILYLQRQHDS